MHGLLSLYIPKQGYPLQPDNKVRPAALLASKVVLDTKARIVRHQCYFYASRKPNAF